ncbi:MAG: hypothetical protein JNM52_07325 [Betaproteobacteria bacterium]|nr:hypothetical protein [Betaproteobacteria bacterium]
MRYRHSLLIFWLALTACAPWPTHGPTINDDRVAAIMRGQVAEAVLTQLGNL